MAIPVHRAVILAAGRGTRMMPLTADRPKPLIAVGGRPILEHILRGVARAGIDEVMIVTGYLGDMLRDFFSDGTALGMRLHYHTQDPPNGTGGALMALEDYCGTEPFLLHWGDILVDPVNYPAILATYAAQPTPPACVLGMNWMDDPCAGAAVDRDASGRVVRITEKPPPGTSTTHWNNAGVLILGPAMWPFLHRITPSPRGEYEFTDVIRGLIGAGECVIGHELTGLWSDVGTPEVVAALNADSRMEVFASV